MPQLEWIDISQFGEADSEIQKLAGNKNLKHVTFNHMDISAETYDVLTAAGIDVEHYGLTHDELSEEYLAYNEIFYPVVADKSEITFWLNENAESSVMVSVSGGEKARHPWSANNPPGIDFYGFSFAGDWRDLEGVKKQFTTDWNDVDADMGNFYDGIHIGTNDHRFEFVSREGNRLRLKWNCRVGDSAEDSVDLEIDAHIPFTRVCLNNRSGDISLQKAKQIVAKQFDLNDFEEPTYWGNRNAVIRFEFKK